MKTTGICPACQGKLSLWTGLKAPTPFHFRCPHCRARLRLAMPGLWPLLIVVVLALIGASAAMVMAGLKHEFAGLLIGLACFGVIGFAVEFVLGVIFYTYGTFTVKAPANDG